MADPAMLAAVTAAVNGAEPPTDSPAADPTPPATDGAEPADAAAPEREDLLGTGGASADPEAGSTPEAPEGQLRGPDGKFLPKEPKEPKEPKDPKEQAADPAAVKPADPPKPPDPINDPIPDTVKAATRERITTLVDTVKAKDAELSSVNQDLELVMSPIREAGATVEQFRESMNLVKLINSPHQHEQMQALKYLQGASAALAQRLGQHVPGTDPLQGFPDLVDEVTAGKLSEQRAAEIAQARRAQAASQQFQQNAQQRSQQEQARQAEMQEGQAAVRAVEQALEASDPQFKAKVAVMRADTAFVNQLRNLPPKQWAPAFAEKYRTIKVAAAAVPTPAGGPAPLRPKQPAGTAAKQPSSQLEAVRGALKMG